MSFRLRRSGRSCLVDAAAPAGIGSGRRLRRRARRPRTRHDTRRHPRTGTRQRSQVASPPPPAVAPPSTNVEAIRRPRRDILAQMRRTTRSPTPRHRPTTTERRQQPTAARRPAPRLSHGDRSVGGRLTDPRDLERPSTASDIVIESEGGIDFDPSFASFGKRTLELIVDTIVLCLVVLPGLVIAAIAGSLWFVGLLVSLIGFVLFVVLTARSIAATGQSLGNRVADTRIVDGINGVNIDVGRAALRVVGAPPDLDDPVARIPDRVHRRPASHLPRSPRPHRRHRPRARGLDRRRLARADRRLRSRARRRIPSLACR